MINPDTGMVDTNVTFEEVQLISEVVKRTYDRVHAQAGESRSTAMLDLMAAHRECPLNLQAMVAEPEDSYDVFHDVLYIRKHIDRRTGKLGDCFTPRFALRNA